MEEESYYLSKNFILSAILETAGHKKPNLVNRSFQKPRTNENVSFTLSNQVQFRASYHLNPFPNKPLFLHSMEEFKICLSGKGYIMTLSKKFTKITELKVAWVPAQSFFSFIFI